MLDLIRDAAPIAAATVAAALVLVVPLLVTSKKSKRTKRKKRRSKRIRDAPKTYVNGLVNQGSNTCFLNAVLQAFASLDYLRSYLEKRASCPPPDNTSNVTIALQHTLCRLNEPLQKRQSFLPTEVVWALRTNAKSLLNREQQDAHELFALLSQALTDEDEELRRPKSLFDVRTVRYMTGHKDSYPFVQNSERNPLLGLTACRVSCMRCGHSGPIRHATFDHVSIPLPQTSSCTLDQVLRSYAGIEFLDEFNCRRCSLSETLIAVEDKIFQLKRIPGKEATKLRQKLGVERVLIKNALENDNNENLDKLLEAMPLKRMPTPASKQTMFAKLPLVLAIHLSRTIFVPGMTGFTGMTVKNTCQVSFPEIVDMSSYSPTGYLANMPSELHSKAGSPLSSPTLIAAGSSRSNDQRSMRNTRINSLTYRLKSVIVHQGDHRNGHFVTYRRKHRDKKWWRTSDEDIREVDLESVLKEEAYMLFYERIGQ
ncbi:1566_t:CDS:1 [Paraglomus occultum]|uniref:ubiquitinyl hydrolase 1 n=1 Tax=Paraglomus occultum TaxID=144539 RepID=A0A9N8Z8C6_9GLOM|nr:1566_t:CDS:1 [Paraglomus occultum]